MQNPVLATYGTIQQNGVHAREKDTTAFFTMQENFFWIEPTTKLN
jgi:hypothetical protein